LWKKFVFQNLTDHLTRGVKMTSKPTVAPADGAITGGIYRPWSDAYCAFDIDTAFAGEEQSVTRGRFGRTQSIMSTPERSTRDLFGDSPHPSHNEDGRQEDAQPGFDHLAGGGARLADTQTAMA